MGEKVVGKTEQNDTDDVTESSVVDREGVRVESTVVTTNQSGRAALVEAATHALPGWIRNDNVLDRAHFEVGMESESKGKKMSSGGAGDNLRSSASTMVGRAHFNRPAPQTKRRQRKHVHINRHGSILITN